MKSEEAPQHVLCDSSPRCPSLTQFSPAIFLMPAVVRTFSYPSPLVERPMAHASLAYGNHG